MQKTKVDLSFSNIVIDKKQLKYLIIWAFRNYGIARAANMADKLKDLGFYYATKAGISLSLEDLRIPPVKKTLLEDTFKLIINTDYRYRRGEITAVERFQKVIDTWNNSSEMLKKEVIKYFKNTDPLNAIYMMAFSGARGNISQVRQLVGMRGLMSDPQGQIIDLPISSNFREGLTVTDYFISSYGARKGLVDTALRTADSGYLTRRLVDVAQDVIIRELDCKTTKGILLESILDNNHVIMNLEQLLIGRVLAEDVVHPLTNNLIARASQDVNDILAKLIIQSGINKVLVRSPITCNAADSVCQKCYGWNLAHGKLVDLGEAVGIIAAQSIGEPGTQLTMRTFHTGGVFTGDFANKIYSPFDALLEHPKDILLAVTRTSHGDKAYLLKEDSSCLLHSIDKKYHKHISLTKNSLLFVDNMSRVLAGQLIAEYPLKSRLVTEKAQKSILSDIDGKIAFTDLTIEEIQNKQNLIRSAQSGGLVWVLSGQVHNIPDNAELMVNLGDFIQPNSVIAIKQTLSDYSGYVEILPPNTEKLLQEIRIVTALQIISNVKIIIDEYYSNSNYILQMYNSDKFLLKIKPKDKLVNNQIVAELISEVYTTKTGGIIKYLDLPVSKKQDNFNNDYYHVLGAGYILWIAEETHEINKEASVLLVKHGDFIDSGTELIKNLFVQNSGIVEIIEKDNIVKEIIVKPCTIYDVDNQMLLHNYVKKRGFLRPGEKIVENIITNRLVYWEYLNLYNKQVLLIRPVIVYSIPHKNYILDYAKNSFQKDALNLCLVRQINFKDGTRVKSVQGVELVKTYLILEILPKFASLTCYFDLIDNNNLHKNLQFSIIDSITIKNSSVTHSNNQIVLKNTLLVSNNLFINKGQAIAQTELLSNVEGQIADIQDIEGYNKRFLILTDIDKSVCYVHRKNAEKIYVNVFDWVYKDQEMAENTYALESGQVIFVDYSKIILRIGRPYLISHGSTLHVDHNTLVKRGENIATLIFNRVKTGDIVQGLPRIEEILEARKKADSHFNPHIMLDNKFNFYLNMGLSLYDATCLSIQEIQLLLIKEVQLVYQSQGVDISDKHIEVIVKQMTSKVRIEQGGDTNYLPGEMVSLYKIETINKTLFAANKQTASYYPILLGITKASLNTESFISAASFQETTKVLTEAAISGKLDWLKGLKENVIIGRLIPAGTGFNTYSTYLNTHKINYQASKDVNITQKWNTTMQSSFEDIILDDRGARHLTKLKHKSKNLQPDNDIL